MKQLLLTLIIASAIILEGEHITEQLIKNRYPAHSQGPAQVIKQDSAELKKTQQALGICGQFAGSLYKENQELKRLVKNQSI